VSDLARLVKLGSLLVERKAAVEAAEAALADLKADVYKIEREDMPNLMAEVGLDEVKLSTGQTITIKEEVETRISEDNRPAAYSWLLEHGYGGIIKTNVSVQFGKGEHTAAEEVTEKLRAQFAKNPVMLEETVHPQTLKSFVKERLSAGDAIPHDLFSIFVFTKAVIKG